MKSFTITSKVPWNITCTVETVGRDLLCRIHGGEVHIGAVAFAQWVGDRVETGCLVGEGHREERIAEHAARELSGVWRSTVVCCCGIHFDGISHREIGEISRAADEVVAQAAHRLADGRLAAEAPVEG